MKSREEREKELISNVLRGFKNVAYIKINGKSVYIRKR